MRLGGTLDTPGANADYVALRELRLERGDRDTDAIVVCIGDRDEPIELRVPDPRAVHVDLTVDGVERGLSIETRDAELTLRFRTAIAPELVDGPPL